MEFIEEAILSGAVEFRYCRKTNVAVTTQSRKVTVLLDIGWEREAERVFDIMEIMLKK